MPLFLAAYSIFPREDKDYYYGTYTPLPPQKKGFQFCRWAGNRYIGTCHMEMEGTSRVIYFNGMSICFLSLAPCESVCLSSCLSFCLSFSLHLPASLMMMIVITMPFCAARVQGKKVKERWWWR